jgi:branched-chain amino acid aminotransferase
LVPTEPGTSLYVRPFMIGDDHSLGVHGVHHAIFMVILSPLGSYYKEGLNPVSILIERDDVRVAGKGGTG